MNKYQEAFIIIERTLEYNCDAELEIIYELVKKATQQKTIKEPIIRDGYRQYKNYCPVCKQEMLILGNYCLYCGQKVDWSSTHE